MTDAELDEIRKLSKPFLVAAPCAIGIGLTALVACWYTDKMTTGTALGLLIVMFWIFYEISAVRNVLKGRVVMLMSCGTTIDKDTSAGTCVLCVMTSFLAFYLLWLLPLIIYFSK